MQQQSSKKPFSIKLKFPGGGTRFVKVKAASQEVAEQRALKFHPTATVVRNES